MKTTSNDSHPFIYVITLTWNQIDDTLDCLESLSQIDYPNYRLLLVDNDSHDNTVTAAKEQFPQVELIVNPKNYGFPGGFNVGIRYALDAGADFVFIINNDTYVEPDLLTQLVEYADQSDIGILGPKIYYADEPNRIWSVGGKCNPWTLEMTKKGDFEEDVGQWETVVEQDYLVGCALLMSRGMLFKIGLLDEGFNPIYYEDVDLCLRARRSDYRLLMVPSAKMWHKVSASGGGSGSPRERHLMARNSVRFFRKHAQGLQWLAIIPFRFGSAIKTTFKLMRNGRYDSAIAYWRGLWAGIIMPMNIQEGHFAHSDDHF